MTFPIIIFSKNDKIMGSSDKPFLMSDIRILEDSILINSQVVDSLGQLYFIKTVEQDSRLLLWESIKSVGLMVKVKPVFSQEPKSVTFEELKIRIKAHVSKNKRFWLPLNDGRGLNKMIDDTTNFEELIKMFV